MFVLQVIPITKSIRSSSLSYFSVKEVALGTLVTVPLRKQEVIAVVVAQESVSDLKTILKSADYTIRNVLKVHDKHLFSSPFLQMAHHIARYNAQPTGVILDTLLPKSVTRDISFFARSFSPVKSGNTHHVSILQRTKEERDLYYKTRVRELFAQNQSLTIVCPTVEECVELHRYVSKAISEKCYLFHGSMTVKKIRTQYAKLHDEKGCTLLITTPGCISFAPENTGEYIIEGSSSSSYRNVTSPYIDKRLCIELTAKFSEVPCVYADSVIDVSLWHRVNESEVDIIEPHRKKVVDPKKLEILSYQPKQEHQSEAERIKELKHAHQGFHPLHYKSLEAIRRAVKEKKKIFVFVPKKGKSPNMVCSDCGKLAVSRSGYPLSLYTHTNSKTGVKENIYVCNATGEKLAAFDECQFCRGVNLKKMGIATGGVAEILTKELGEKVPISIIDAQSCKTKKAVNEVQKFHAGKKAHVFVGTSKVLSVLPCWDIAVLVTLAPLLSKMSYRNEEELIDFIAHVQERTRDTVYLQDRKDMLSSFPILETGLHQPFVEEQLEERNRYQYPPYQRLVQLKVEVKKTDAKRMYEYLLKKYERYDPSVMVSPHSAQFVVLNMLIKRKPHEWSLTYQDQPLLSLLQDHERNVEVVIDPLSIT